MLLRLGRITTVQKNMMYPIIPVRQCGKDLFTGETWSTIFGGAWTSIDVTSGSEVTVDGHTYKGNTIISDYFKMHLQAYGNSEKYGVSRVGVLTDALLLNGDFLNKTGTTVNDSIPWYLHPFSQNAGSAGCIGPMSAEYFEGSWNKPNEPTSGAWYMDQFYNKLTNHGYMTVMNLTCIWAEGSTVKIVLVIDLSLFVGVLPR